MNTKLITFELIDNRYIRDDNDQEVTIAMLLKHEHKIIDNHGWIRLPINTSKHDN